jgi:hypothetical protein
MDPCLNVSGQWAADLIANNGGALCDEHERLARNGGGLGNGDEVALGDRSSLRGIRKRISEFPHEPRRLGCQASSNVEHGAQVGRSSTMRQDAKAKGRLVKQNESATGSTFIGFGDSCQVLDG